MDTFIQLPFQLLLYNNLGWMVDMHLENVYNRYCNKFGPHRPQFTYRIWMEPTFANAFYAPHCIEYLYCSSYNDVWERLHVALASWYKEIYLVDLSQYSNLIIFAIYRKHCIHPKRLWWRLSSAIKVLKESTKWFFEMKIILFSVLSTHISWFKRRWHKNL